MKRVSVSPTLVAIALAVLVPFVGHSVTHAAQRQVTAQTQSAPATEKAPATTVTPQSQAAPAAKPASAGAKVTHAKAKTSAHKATAHTPRLNLNTATKEELAKLPGVGDETAAKIVAARPFTSRAELVNKKILTSEEYKKVERMVWVPSPKSSAHAKAAKPAAEQPKTGMDDSSGGSSK
jgi:competence protein ComEA